MPLYEYECEACGQRFEVIQKFSDPPVEHCRTCGGPVQKLLSSPAIQFKGSGWYITDYSRKGTQGSQESKGSEGSGSAESGSKGSGAESAPAPASTSAKKTD